MVCSGCFRNVWNSAKIFAVKGANELETEDKTSKASRVAEFRHMLIVRKVMVGLIKIEEVNGTERRAVFIQLE